MLKRGYKLIICVVLVAALLVGFAASSYAVAPLVAGAGLLGSALGSLGVDLLAGGAATAASLAIWLNNDWSLQGIITGVADGYIKVGDSSVTIDGKVYDSIFLDPSMASVLHTQAFDFITQNAITSNSSGILASGVGYVNGVPMFQKGSNIISQNYTIGFPYNDTSSWLLGDTFAIGNYNITTATARISGWYRRGVTFNAASPSYASYGSDRPTFSPTGYVYVANYNGTGYRVLSEYDTPLNNTPAALDEEAFDYSYVAGTIDATPLPSNYGFQAFVPHSIINDYGISAGTYDPTTTAGTDIINAILQAIDEAKTEDEVLEADFVETVTPPVPPQPIPTNALGDVPYPDFLDTFGQSVYSKLDALHDIVDTVGTAIESAIDAVEGAIDTVGQSVVTAVNNARTVIDTIGQSVITLLQGIRTAIGTATGTIVDAIEAVESAVEGLAENILEDIETAPINVFSTALDVIKVVFAPIIAALKACIGLWHYVVEWVQATAPVFSSFFGFMSGTSYNMVLPIYASLAGPIVIAVYKRFGK